jgi:hypothetical protein
MYLYFGVAGPVVCEAGLEDPEAIVERRRVVHFFDNGADTLIVEFRPVKADSRVYAGDAERADCVNNTHEADRAVLGPYAGSFVAEGDTVARFGLVDVKRASVFLIDFLGKSGDFVVAERGIVMLLLYNAAVVDHTGYGPGDEGAATVSKHPDLVIIGVVVYDELIDGNALLSNCRSCRAVPQVLEKGLVQTNTFLIPCYNVLLEGLDSMDFGCLMVPLTAEA